MLIDLKKKKIEKFWININKYSWERNNCRKMKEWCIIAFYIVGIGNVLNCTSVYPPIAEKYAASFRLQGLGKRFIPSAVWDTPSLPQKRRCFQVNFSHFFPPSIIILLILERYQAHGHSSNLSSTFNYVETKGTCRVSFLHTNIYRVERSFGWE